MIQKASLLSIPNPLTQRTSNKDLPKSSKSALVTIETSFPDAACSRSPCLGSQLLTMLGHKLSLWWTSPHLYHSSPIAYKVSLLSFVGTTSPTSNSGTGEPIWELLCSNKPVDNTFQISMSQITVSVEKSIIRAHSLLPSPKPGKIKLGPDCGHCYLGLLPCQQRYMDLIIYKTVM